MLISPMESPLHPYAEPKASSYGGPDLRGHGGVASPPKGIPRRALPEVRIRVLLFFWYPIDCEIAPISKKGHGGRRNEPGGPIKCFYQSWRLAVTDGGFPGLLFHDLRRSAVRNVAEKIGMSEKRAKEPWKSAATRRDPVLIGITSYPSPTFRREDKKWTSG